MADLGGFDASQVEPAGDFEAIPAGRYEAMIIDSERVANKSGVGSHIKFTFVVTDGECRDRMVWARLNLDNPNAKAVQIARGELSSICRAVNVLTPKDSSDLHNLPLIIRVDVRQDGEKTYNDVKGYYPKDGPGAASKETEKRPIAPASKGSAPWSKK